MLHDLFDVPFAELAPLVGRSPTAARQLASRARRRVQGQAQGAATMGAADLTRQRAIVDAFLAASRGSGFAALLDPNVVVRADHAAVAAGASQVVRGAAAVAKQFSRRAQGAQGARPALVNGAVGLIVAPRGRLRLVLSLTITGSKIVAIEVIADPVRLRQLDLAVLGG